MFGSAPTSRLPISAIANGLSIKDYVKGPSQKRIWSPRPGSQVSVYNSTATMIGYGGEAGGGKTDTAFGLSYYKHRRSIIFRAEFSQMDNQIIARGQEVYRNVATLIRGHRRRFEFEKGGFLALGALKNDGDFNRYQGAGFDAMFFDEAPNIRSDEVLSVLGWLRSKDPKQLCQAYFFFNPPTTIEGEWIIDYFAPWIDDNYSNPAEEGEIRWFCNVEGESIEVENSKPFWFKGELMIPQSRTFFRSRLEENPNFGAQYRAQLMSLPPLLSQKLLHGDFTVGLGDDHYQVFRSADVADSIRRWKPYSEPPGELLAIGVDPARGGMNQTVICKRYNNWIAPLIKIPGSETPDGGSVAKLVMDHVKENPEVRVYIDALGVGTSPVDALRATGINLYEVNFGAGSTYVDSSGLYPMGNYRAEVFWQLKELLEGDPVYINLPKEEDLRRQLNTIRFKLPNGKVIVESKDDINKRVGRSIDEADAVALACMGMYDDYQLVA